MKSLSVNMFRITHASSLLVLLAVAIPSSIVAQAPIPIKESKIINGFDVAPGRFPYSVSLQSLEMDNFHFCGGSLIGKCVIEQVPCHTAGICVYNEPYK